MPDTIKLNEALVRTWIDDTSTHTVEDRYVRSVLASMLAESRNPNSRGHTGPMTVALCERWSRQEREHAVLTGCRLCAASARTLDQLATKLHD